MSDYKRLFALRHIDTRMNAQKVWFDTKMAAKAARDAHNELTKGTNRVCVTVGVDHWRYMK